MPFNKVIQDSSKKHKKVKNDSSSACWMLQMAHQPKRYPDPSGEHVIFCDNFYTCHIIASSLKDISEEGSSN
jgi:hypothetical protein